MTHWFGYVLGSFMVGMAYGGYIVWGVFMREMPGVITGHAWRAHAVLVGCALVPIIGQWLINRAHPANRVQAPP